MSYFVTPQASSNQIAGAINYILANLNTNVNPNFTTGIVNSTNTTATGTNGQTSAYLYRYLDVAYADNGSGSVNFSSSPLSTNSFYGLRNTNSSVYSTNPADYVWYQIVGTFSGGKLLWYQTFGGLQVNLIVATSAPSTIYQQVPNGIAIDLTLVSTATNLQGRSAYAVSSTSLSSTPATYSTTGNSTFPPNNTWGGSETWGASSPTYTASQNVYQIDGIYNPGTNLTLWTTPYLATLKVGSLSAITATLGAVNAGTITASSISSSTLSAGTTPPVIDATNHTIVSGTAGGLINPNGTFAFGDNTNNIVDDGTGIYLNGFSYGSGSSTGSFTLGSTSSATLMPAGGGNFTITRSGKGIVTCYGVFIVRTTTTGTIPYSVGCTALFQILNASSTVIGTASLIFNGAIPLIVNSSPYVNQYGVPYSFSIFISNFTPGSYTLICNGASTYSSLNFRDSSANLVTPTSANITLTANSFWYQIA